MKCCWTFWAQSATQQRHTAQYTNEKHEKIHGEIVILQHYTHFINTLTAFASIYSISFIQLALWTVCLPIISVSLYFCFFLINCNGIKMEIKDCHCSMLSPSVGCRFESYAVGEVYFLVSFDFELWSLVQFMFRDCIRNSSMVWSWFIHICCCWLCRWQCCYSWYSLSSSSSRQYSTAGNEMLILRVINLRRRWPFTLAFKLARLHKITNKCVWIIILNFIHIAIWKNGKERNKHKSKNTKYEPTILKYQWKVKVNYSVYVEAICRMHHVNNAIHRFNDNSLSINL